MKGKQKQESILIANFSARFMLMQRGLTFFLQINKIQNYITKSNKKNEKQICKRITRSISKPLKHIRYFVAKIVPTSYKMIEYDKYGFKSKEKQKYVKRKTDNKNIKEVALENKIRQQQPTLKKKIKPIKKQKQFLQITKCRLIVQGVKSTLKMYVQKNVCPNHDDECQN